MRGLNRARQRAEYVSSGRKALDDFERGVGAAFAVGLAAIGLVAASKTLGLEGPAVIDEAVISPVFTPEVQHWGDKIGVWAETYGLDPDLVATVMQIESCGNPDAVSPSGAQGLFQVMPFHFAESEDMTDPDTNAARGLAYLALGLTRAGGNAGLALAGYNGGHSVIGKDSSLWSEETKRYWYWGTGIYGEAQAGEAHSDRLDEWLAAGGAGLCAQAAAELGLK